MAAGVPVVPGTDRRRCRPMRPTPTSYGSPASIGYPVMVKAVAGGGGKGMRAGRDAATSSRGALRAARSEALSAFGDGAVYLERRLERPRHIEVQLLGDEHGTVVPFVERECSIQRRHQKVLEESPSPAVTPDAARGAWPRRPRAVARARSATRTPARSSSCSTPTAQFYFLEMNTRLQVEHPITEAVTGIDLVQWQFRLAGGERLDHRPGRGAHAARSRDRVPRLRRGSRSGLHAVARAASRTCARRRARASATTAGTSAAARCRSSTTRSISKLIAWGANRDARRSRACAARSAEYEIAGIRTTHSVLPVVARRAGLPRRRASTRRCSIACWPARNGTPFAAADADAEDVAAIAAALDAVLRAARTAHPATERRPSSAWTRSARARGAAVDACACSSRSAAASDEVAIERAARDASPCTLDGQPVDVDVRRRSAAAAGRCGCPARAASTRSSSRAAATGGRRRARRRPARAGHGVRRGTASRRQARRRAAMGPSASSRRCPARSCAAGERRAIR